jgi:hypothetical protein
MAVAWTCGESLARSITGMKEAMVIRDVRISVESRDKILNLLDAIGGGCPALSTVLLTITCFNSLDFLVQLLTRSLHDFSVCLDAQSTG